MQLSTPQPNELDIIELLRSKPELSLTVGDRGTILEVYPDRQYLVEFADDNGETIALCDLDRSDFVVTWQAETERTVSIEERFLSVISQLSSQRQQQAWEFMRLLIDTSEV
jgi:hypothetical protein